MSDASSPERLARQLDFLIQIDALKRVDRQTNITGGSRRENTAEHSWHLALFAMTLLEHSNSNVDALRVLQLCLVHDIVEVDAGDTFAYDASGYESKAERETRAAERIFGLLPSDQGGWFRALWDEYEVGQTPESRFANAVDRLQPVLLNFLSGDDAPWKRHAVTRDQVIERNEVIRNGSQPLWDLALERIDAAVREGYLHDGPAAH